MLEKKIAARTTTMTWATRTRRLCLSLLALATLVMPTACGSMVSSDTGCPSYLVTLDASATGFSSAGEWRTDAVCAQYCTADFPVCQLVNQSTVKCQKGCA